MNVSKKETSKIKYAYVFCFNHFFLSKIFKHPTESFFPCQWEKSTLIHHQGTTCCVDCGRSSLRSMTYTPHSSLLVALHLAPCWWPGIVHNPMAQPANENLIVDLGRLYTGHYHMQESNRAIACNFFMITPYPFRSVYLSFAGWDMLTGPKMLIQGKLTWTSCCADNYNHCSG